MKRLFRSTPRFVLVLLALAIFGWIRAPIEDRMRAELVSANLLYPPPAQSAFEQMSQSTMMGTLGGLRSLVATYMTLEAFEHFSTKAWDDLRQSYQVVLSLEPREEAHWVAVTWHLGINATANVEYDESLPSFERERRFKEYAFQAIDFAERGIAQLPDSAAIRLQLAEVYREKLKDNCATARVYKDTIGRPGALSYVRRFYGYFLARCPGSEREAYDYLMSLYDEGEDQHLPTLIKEIKNMEIKLNIPQVARILDPDPDAPMQHPNAKKQSSQQSGKTLPGGIVVP